MSLIPWQTRTVYVLGAGFSKPAGLSLGTELWREVRNLANGTDLSAGLEHQIRIYLKYMRTVHNPQFSETDIDLEKFVTFLDIVSLLGLGAIEPPHQPDETPNVTRALQLVRNLVAQTLFERQSSVKEEELQVYREFARRLKPDDVVITFNYDTLLESALDCCNRSYRYSFYVDSNLVSEPSDVILLKMHGSIDWFEEVPQNDHRRYDYQCESIYPVSVGKRYGAHEILKTDQKSDNRLGRILRIRDHDGYFSHGSMSSDIPLVVAPSHENLIYLAPLLEFWRAFSDSNFVKRVVIIGYSLPSYDQYAQIALYRLATGKHCTLVDFWKSEDDICQLKKHYQFIDWDKADCYFDGFNMEAIKKIFDE